jgi:hemoglobin
VSEEHRANVTRGWIEVFGGSPTYTDEIGGHESMLAHHRGLGITPEQRLRFATLMSLAADDASLPDDPEFRAAFMGYVEWGTRLALHNPQPDAIVTEHAPVPRWGWGWHRHINLPSKLRVLRLGWRAGSADRTFAG